MQRLVERFIKCVGEQKKSDDLLILPFDLRQKSRFLTALESGEEVAVMLPRGTFLSSGDLLRSEAGTFVEVRAAIEEVSTAHADDPHLLARACYHLGNRHIPVQIGLTWLRYFNDYVLDDMLRQLGLRVVQERAPFEPEAGAYAGHRPHHD